MGVIGLGLMIIFIWFINRGDFSTQESSFFNADLNFKASRVYIPSEVNGSLIESLKKHVTLSPRPLMIVSFWAKWCAPCVVELPEFVALSKLMSHELQIILINTDKDLENTQLFSNQLSLNSLDHIYDKKHLETNYKKIFNIDALPYHFIFKNNKLILAFRGSYRWSQPKMVNKLKGLLTKAEKH